MDMDFQNGMKKIFDEVIDGIKSGTEGFLNEEKKAPESKKVSPKPRKDTVRSDEGLQNLGSKNTKYATDYAPEVLETFNNKHPENDYFV